MSAVRAARSVSPEPSAPDADVQLMQDVLYDILATGIDTDQTDVAIADIERFLCEHARSPRSADEFRAFFADHGLSVRARGSEPLELALPDIARADAGAAVQPPPLQLAAPAPAVASEAVTAAHAPVAFEPTAAAVGPRRALAFAAWFAALSMAALCAAAAWYGQVAIGELRAELARAHAQSSADREAIRTLKDQTAGLESSVSAGSELLQRVDHKSDFVVQSLLEQAEARRHPGRRRH